MALRFTISEDAPRFRLERLHREFAAECREKRPLPSPETFDGLDHSQYEVIKTLIWQRRKVFVPCRKVVGSWQVFISTMLGLAAFVEATGGRSENTILLTCEESKQVQKRVKRENLSNELHSNHFLYFDALNPQEEDYRRDYGYLGGMLLCLRDGNVSGPLCGSGTNSIWHWDGQELKQVDEGCYWIS